MNAFTKKLVSLLDAKKKNQDGFTLLELLVVVAIMAAVAGTATIALKDTDARASAAAHVSMMDELNKGIRTYRVIKKNELPSRFDSMMVSASKDLASPGAVGLVSTAGFEAGDVDIRSITDEEMAILYAGGIEELQYINEASPALDNNNIVPGTLDCSNTLIGDLVSSRGNAIVGGNIFMSPEANGCGYTVKLASGEDDTVTFTDAPQVVYWSGGSERLTGQEDPAGTPSLFNADDNYAYLITGIGPSSTLFNANELGGMTTVPVYRHVKAEQYGRFFAVWNVGTYSSNVVVAGDQAELVAIVDGALDTKEEELGEWDGTRNTI